MVGVLTNTHVIENVEMAKRFKAMFNFAGGRRTPFSISLSPETFYKSSPVDVSYLIEDRMSISIYYLFSDSKKRASLMSRHCYQTKVKLNNELICLFVKLRKLIIIIKCDYIVCFIEGI